MPFSQVEALMLDGVELILLIVMATALLRGWSLFEKLTGLLDEVSAEREKLRARVKEFEEDA